MTSSVLPPVVGINFVADSLSGIPPDNYAAVSKGYKAVAVMNSNITVHDATTGAILNRKALGGFSSITLLNNNNYFRYDPKVVYDPEADRFICVMLAGEDQFNYIIMAFSKTNDPAGAWNFYKFYGDYAGDTTWFDYPAISITHNELFLTGNKIKYDSTWQAGFTRSLIYQVRKQDGYDGDSLLTYQIWDSVQYNNKFLRCLYPLNPGESVLGPSQYFLSNRNFDLANDTVFLVKIPDTIGSVDSILTVTPVVSSTTSYGTPPDGRQPDTTIPLATNDGRILGGFMEGDEIQFVSTSVNPANGSSGIYHGVISSVSTAPSLSAQLFSIDSLDFGYPNISFAGFDGGPNHSIISFDYSGPATYPGFGAILFDGSNYSDTVVIRHGDTTINEQGAGEQRWGDYSGSQPDWTTPGSVWVVGIYGKKYHSSNIYGDYMAQLISPYHTGVPVISPAVATTAKLFPNPSFEYINFEFNVIKDQVFSFYIYDINGKLVDKVTDNYCREGQNILKFNIAPLAPGTYFLRATGSLGEGVPSKMFERQ